MNLLSCNQNSVNFIQENRREAKSMIKVKNLKKQFGNNVVLKDISVAIEKGEVISVIGPSGSGKSIFL